MEKCRICSWGQMEPPHRALSSSQGIPAPQRAHTQHCWLWNLLLQPEGGQELTGAGEREEGERGMTSAALHEELPHSHPPNITAHL